MNTCFQSTIPAPVALPAVGTLGTYILPAIVIRGEVLAKESRYPVRVIGHIGTFGLHLEETANPRLRIETHFASFEPASA